MEVDERMHKEYCKTQSENTTMQSESRQRLVQESEKLQKKIVKDHYS